MDHPGLGVTDGPAEKDPGPVARFEAVKADPNTPDEVFARIAKGDTLRKIARAWRVPSAAFSEWYMLAHGDRYEAARVARAEDLIDEALETAVKDLDKDEVPAAKLRAELLMKVASKYDRDRYGESIKVTRGVQVSVDAGLIGFASQLLDRIRPVGRMIEGETLTIPDIPAPVGADSADDEDEGRTL